MTKDDNADLHLLTARLVASLGLPRAVALIDRVKTDVEFALIAEGVGVPLPGDLWVRVDELGIEADVAEMIADMVADARRRRAR